MRPVSGDDGTELVSKPKALDCFSGAGGMARGLRQAGSYVVGIDNRPMPRYGGDEFHQDDALDVLRRLIVGETWQGYVLSDFAAIHASPPCQFASRTRQLWNRDHPDLVAVTRELLIATGLPYIIENVPGAPLINPVVLEGQMFDGLRTQRTRLFETNWPLYVPFMRSPRPAPNAKMGRVPKEHEWMHVVGHFSGPGGEALGIDWMTRAELAQAIPPAYGRYIGEQLLLEVQARAAA